jgi:hypothetical protein
MIEAPYRENVRHLRTGDQVTREYAKREKCKCGRAFWRFNDSATRCAHCLAEEHAVARVVPDIGTTSFGLEE